MRMVPPARSHPARGVSAGLLLFLLGFLGTGFLIVTLYPYRVLILHLLIGLLLLTLVVVWLIVVIKVRRRVRARRELPPAYPLRVHDDAPGEHPIPQDELSPLPPFSHFQYSDTSDFAYLYDDRNSKRPSERLDPDQRRRF